MGQPGPSTASEKIEEPETSDPPAQTRKKKAGESILPSPDACSNKYSIFDDGKIGGPADPPLEQALFDLKLNPQPTVEDAEDAEADWTIPKRSSKLKKMSSGKGKEKAGELQGYTQEQREAMRAHDAAVDGDAS